MKIMRKLVLGVACAGGLYGLWQVCQPPQVDAVHTLNGQPWLVLVRYFPLTQQGKIDWWDRNQATLMAKYKIPADDFDLTFMAWGGNYLVDPGRDALFFEDADAFDLLCFAGVDSKENCVEKDTLMNVGRRSDGGVQFTVEGITGRSTYVRDPGSDVLRFIPD